MKFISQSALQTKKFGRFLGQEILKSSFGQPAGQLAERQSALILALEGDLGSGKTTFVQGLARGLGLKDKILSPTFVILKKFRLKFRSSCFKAFYHLDCYRLGRAEDLADLDFKALSADPSHIIVVEWADRVKKILPQSRITITFRWLSPSKREIVFI